MSGFFEFLYPIKGAAAGAGFMVGALFNVLAGMLGARGARWKAPGRRSRVRWWGSPHRGHVDAPARDPGCYSAVDR